MANMGGFSARGLQEFQKQLEKIQQRDMEAFLAECAKELAARLLSKVIRRTPVGEYPKSTGKKGGTLRRGWTSKTHADAAGGGSSKAKEYADSLEVRHEGNTFTIEIVNPVEYASYVEYGHRTRGGRGWVPGRFMLTISEQEIQQIAPKVLERKIKNFLEGCMS